MSQLCREWIGLGVGQHESFFVDWIGLGQEKVTHVQLCVTRDRYCSVAIRKNARPAGTLSAKSRNM